MLMLQVVKVLNDGRCHRENLPTMWYSGLYPKTRTRLQLCFYDKLTPTVA